MMVRLVVYVGCALGLHLTGCAAYWYGVARHHKALRSDTVVAAAPERIAVLVVGDSHPRTAVDPRTLAPGTVNAAVGGQSLIKTYYRTRTLVEQLDKTVETLIVPLDAVSLTGWNAEQLGPEVVWGRYVDFIELGRVRGQRLRYFGLWIEAHLVPYMGELRSINQVRTGRFGFGESLPNANFGRQPLRARLRAARETAESHLVGGWVDPTQVWALDQLVGWAEGQGMRVVFVRYPVTRAYAWHVADARVAVDEAVLGPIVDPVRHLVLDHEGAFFGRDQLFSDPHHVNARGRRWYTRWLGFELRRHGVVGDRHDTNPP